MKSFFAPLNSEKTNKHAHQRIQDTAKENEQLSSSKGNTDNHTSCYNRSNSLPEKVFISTALAHLGTFKRTSSLLTEKMVKRVLIADDNVMNRVIIKRQLEKFHITFQFDEAVNGKEAVTLCCKHHYDLILMDIEMPIMNGYEATQAIRDITQTTTPILALTSLTTDDAKVKCFESGMNAYLFKPITQNDLSEALNKWFKLSVHNISSDISATLVN